MLNQTAKANLGDFKTRFLLAVVKKRAIIVRSSLQSFAAVKKSKF